MLSVVQEIDLLQTGLLPDLVSDYLSGKEELNPFISYPHTFDSFEKAIADKKQQFIDRALLSEVLNTQYAVIPTVKAVLDNIQLLKEENTFTVTAAHQPCLFMGPLYNIYKIAAAIHTSIQLKEKFPGYHFVPVFWLGSEDHDVEELNQTHVSGVKIEWKECGTGASGRWNTESMVNALNDLKNVHDNHEIISIIENGLISYKTFGSFSQYFVNELFQEYGLVVLDQDNPLFKKKFTPIIIDEVMNNRAATVLQPTLTYLELQYKIQAKPRDINFFYLGEGFRERIVWNKSSDRFEINNKAIHFSKEEIIEEIHHHPERFSPNVILRPLYQEMILPNLAFTGGAGELSYWLQLKAIFDYYKVNFPILAHRPSIAISNNSVQRKIDKLELSYNDFFKDTNALISGYMQKSLSEEQQLGAEKEKLDALFTDILIKAEKSDSTLKGTVMAEKQKALTSLQNLESKMLKAEKRKQETVINQIKGVKDILFPGNILQERRENFIPYYNSSFISKIVELADPFKKHFLILSEL